MALNEEENVSRVAGRITAICVRLMLSSRVLEGLLLAVFRTFKSVQPFKAIWWRLRSEYEKQTRGSDKAFRWVRLPHSNAKILMPVNSFFGEFFFEGKVYEQATADFIARTLGSGDVFIDVGSNIGYFALMAADIVGESGRVYGFEPNPMPFDLQQRSIERNCFKRNVRLFSCVLTETDGGEVDLYLPVDESNFLAASISPQGEFLKSGALSADSTVQVRARTFDSVVREEGIDRIDIVKIDVEGAEINVLRGMAQTMKKLVPRHIICETSIGGEIDKYLSSFGYKAVPLEYMVEDEKWGNILFSKDETAALKHSGLSRRS